MGPLVSQRVSPIGGTRVLVLCKGKRKRKTRAWAESLPGFFLLLGFLGRIRPASSSSSFLFLLPFSVTDVWVALIGVSGILCGFRPIECGRG